MSATARCDNAAMTAAKSSIALMAQPAGHRMPGRTDGLDGDATVESLHDWLSPWRTPQYCPRPPITIRTGGRFTPLPPGVSVGGNTESGSGAAYQSTV
jgi:hypothetical protein